MVVRSNARGAALLVAGVAGLCSLALLTDGAAARSGGRPLNAHGLSIALPAGWDGRIVKPTPRTATQLIAADFPLPRLEDFDGPKTAKAMHPASIYLWIANLGSANSKHLLRGLWKDGTFPISASRADLHPFEGASSPSEAVRWLFVKQKALLILVGFGRQHPSDEQLARANRVLSTFRLTPTR